MPALVVIDHNVVQCFSKCKHSLGKIMHFKASSYRPVISSEMFISTPLSAETDDVPLLSRIPHYSVGHFTVYFQLDQIDDFSCGPGGKIV